MFPTTLQQGLGMKLCVHAACARWGSGINLHQVLGNHALYHAHHPSFHTCVFMMNPGLKSLSNGNSCCISSTRGKHWLCGVFCFQSGGCHCHKIHTHVVPPFPTLCSFSLLFGIFFLLSSGLHSVWRAAAIWCVHPLRWMVRVGLGGGGIHFGKVMLYTDRHGGSCL